MNYKIGDKVKIICIDKVTSTHSVLGKIGHTGIVKKYTSLLHMPYTIYFESDNTLLNFMEKELKLYNEVGKQLLFSFMEEV